MSKKVYVIMIKLFQNPMDIYEFPDVRHDKRDNDSKFNGLITRNNPKSAGLQKIQSRLFGFFFYNRSLQIRSTEASCYVPILR